MLTAFAHLKKLLILSQHAAAVVICESNLTTDELRPVRTFEKLHCLVLEWLENEERQKNRTQNGSSKLKTYKGASTWIVFSKLWL